MKLLLRITFILFLGSCTQSSEKRPENDQAINQSEKTTESNQYNEMKDNLIRISMNSVDLTEKAFHVSDKLAVNCQPILDCDCCGGWILTNPDSTFLHQDICSPETFLSFGKFHIEDTALVLEFSGKIRMKTYIEETGKYQFIDTMFSESKEVFIPYSCNNETLLVNNLNGRAITKSNSKHVEKLSDLNREFQLTISKK